MNSEALGGLASRPVERIRSTMVAARRVSRGGWIRRVTVLVGLGVAAAIALNITMSAWSLSKTQVATRDFGRFDQLVSTDLSPSPGDRAGRLAETLRQHRLTESSVVVLQSFDVLPEAGQAKHDSRWIFTETEWTRHPYPGLRLREGRWPVEPGEVVVTGAPSLALDQKLAVLSDRATFQVVGVGSDDYSRAPRLLAAPGTWAQLPVDASRGRQGLVATTSVLCADPTQSGAVRDRLRSLGARTTLQDRSGAVAERSWIDQSPFAYTVPAIVLPILLGGVGVLIGRRRSDSFVRRATQLGMTSGAAVTAIGLAVLAACLLGLAGGAAAGIALGALLRLPVATWSDQVLGPYPSIGQMAAPMLAGTLAVVAAAVATSATSLRRGRSHSRTRGAATVARIPLQTSRRFLSLAAACGAVFAFFAAESAGSAMVFGGLLTLSWMLMIPDVMDAIARALPRETPRSRLVREHLGRRGPAVGPATALLTVMLVLPLATAVLLGASGSTQRSNLLADVGENQVGVFGRGGFAEPAPAGILPLVQGRLRAGSTSKAVRLHFASNAWYDVPRGNASVVAVDTPEQVELVWGRKLDSAQRRALADGSGLAWQPGATLLIDDRAVPRFAPKTYVPREEWADKTGLVMLTSTARSRGIDLLAGGTIFTGVTNADAQRALDDVKRAGLDGHAVHLWHPPKAPVSPPALVFSAAVLFALLLTATWITSRSQVASLGRQMRTLVAVGAPRSFARGTVLMSQLISLGLALLAAITIAGAVAGSLVLRVKGVHIDPPIGVIAGCLVSFVAAAVGAIWLAVSTLRPIASAAR